MKKYVPDYIVDENGFAAKIELYEVEPCSLSLILFIASTHCHYTALSCSTRSHDNTYSHVA